MRFGMRLGPFWVSTSTRRRRRPTQARRARAERARSDAEDLALQQRLARMTPEEYYRLHAKETDPSYQEWLHLQKAGQEAETEAELQRLKDELASVHFRCQACGSDGYELVSGELGAVDMVVRCTSCGALHRARKAEEPGA